MVTEAELQHRAHEMRRNPTEWEKRLWRAVANSQIGYKFRRQAVIHPYICDFLCPAKARVLDIDGDTHDPEYDMRRNAFLRGKGFEMVRVTNLDVRDNVAGVVEHLLATLAARPDRWSGRPHPNPCPEREGLVP